MILFDAPLSTFLPNGISCFDIADYHPSLVASVSGSCYCLVGVKLCGDDVNHHRRMPAKTERSRFGHVNAKYFVFDVITS